MSKSKLKERKKIGMKINIKKFAVVLILLIYLLMTESLGITNPEILIDPQKILVCPGESSLFFVRGIPNHNITVSSSCPDYTHFDFSYRDIPRREEAIFDATIYGVIDEDGERAYKVYFTQTGDYTITVKDEDANIEDKVTITVVECPVFMGAPRHVIIGQDLRIKGSTAYGKYVDIAIDGEVIPMLNDIPINEEGTFEVEISTIADYTPASLKIPGPVKIKAYIDRASSENIQPNEVEDGSITVTMAYPHFAPELSTKAVGLGDTFSIKGLALPGYVDILAIAPRGGSGIGLSGNIPLRNTKITGVTHWRIPVGVDELAFSKEIKVYEHADPGMYAIIVLSPGLDGKYNGINSTNILDIVDGRYGDLFTKAKSEIINITLKATVEKEGSDDWWWMDEIKVGPIVTPAPTVTPMSIHEPAGQTPAPQAATEAPLQRNEFLMLIGVICSVIVVILGTGVGIKIVKKIKTTKKEAHPPLSESITIERTIYDPTKRDFIISKPRSLSNVKNWIERNDPSMYWLIMCINNNSNKSIDRWDVKLDLPSVLKILNARIEGIEHILEAQTESSSEIGSIRYVFSVPSQLRTTIPSNGSSRMYFKIIADADACGIPYSIKGKVSTPDGEIQIKEKQFKYSCDVNTIKNAIKENVDLADDYVSSQLKGRYSTNDFLKLIESFRIVLKMDRMCGDKYARKEEYLDCLNALKNYTEGFSDKFTKQVDEFARFMKEEQLGYLDDEYKEKVRRFCTNLIDVWISEFLKG